MNLREVEVALADYKHLLSIEEATDCFYIKAGAWLKSDTFRQINDQIKECGGKYVSMGKDSHWEIPFEGAPKPRTVNDEMRHETMKIIAELQGYIQKLEKLTK